MGWGTMATLDLVNLAKELESTLDEPPKSKIANTIDLQLWQMRGSKDNQRTPTFAITATSKDTGKGNAVSLKVEDSLGLLTSVFQVFLIPNDRALRSYRGFFQSFHLIILEKFLF